MVIHHLEPADRRNTNRKLYCWAVAAGLGSL